MLNRLDRCNHFSAGSIDFARRRRCPRCLPSGVPVVFAAGQVATVVPDSPPALAAHLDDLHLWHFDWGGVLDC